MEKRRKLLKPSERGGGELFGVSFGAMVYWLLLLYVTAVQAVRKEGKPFKIKLRPELSSASRLKAERRGTADSAACLCKNRDSIA